MNKGSQGSHFHKLINNRNRKLWKGCENYLLKHSFQSTLAE